MVRGPLRGGAAIRQARLLQCGVVQKIGERRRPVGAGLAREEAGPGAAGLKSHMQALDESDPFLTN